MRSVTWMLVLCSLAFATVEVKIPFASHMVLQRRQNVPVWGTASAGEAVTVTLAGITQKATANGSGSWRVLFPAMEAGGPYNMVFKGTNTITLSDVMVGEVWHCAGQSNMDTRMNYYEYPLLADSITKANYPLLRYVTLRQPGQTIQWQQVNPTSVAALSATGYFFGRELLDNLDGVAVGLVVTAVGGTVIEQWLDPATKAADAALANDASAGSMYTEWIQPVEGFAVKGTVWLQGENNTRSSNYATYGARLAKMIPGWRKAWGQNEMPFLVAGLCYKGTLQTTAGESSNEASIRDMQRVVTDTLAHTWLAVLLDLGSETTWHYPQKPEAGKRLGRLARGALYGHTGFGFLSPRPQTIFRRANQIVIPFDTRGGTLELNSGHAPTGFALAGTDNNWSWASSATLKGDTVFLTTSLGAPTQVRYAWANQPLMNLVSDNNLPATPFQLPISNDPAISSSSSGSGSSSSEASSSSAFPIIEQASFIQGENFCTAQGVSENSNMNYAGSGYLNFTNSDASHAEFITKIEYPQSSLVTFRFANGGATSRNLSIALNGNIVLGDLAFPHTGSWTQWQTVSVSLNFAAGRSLIGLQSLTSDGGPNLDWIAFEQEGFQVAPCSEPPVEETLVLIHPNRYTSPTLFKNESGHFYNLLGRSTVPPSR